MKFESTEKYLRISPRKMRLVADGIRYLSIADALSALDQMPKRAGRILAKAIRSAQANAAAKNILIENLRFDKIEVMEGPSMKRWRAVSRGRAHEYFKRMTHVRIVLTEKEILPKKSKKEVGSRKKSVK